jgi:Uma2 family endonuclease
VEARDIARRVRRRLKCPLPGATLCSVVQHAKVTWTYHDLELMPNDRNRYEVVGGALIVTPSPTTTHQKVSKRIGYEFMLQIEHPGAGIVFYAPLDVIFDQTNTVEPDLLVVRTERKNIISERGIEGAPDLVVEILSPSTARNDRELKKKLYADRGVREYWIVDPAARSIEVLALGGAGYDAAGTYGPGATATSGLFSVSVTIDALFAD